MIQFSENSSTGLDTVLQRSMCLSESRFLNATDSLADDRSIELWIVRVAYMAMHRLQHQFAVQEAEGRKDMTDECQQLADQYGIGRFDYECPKAKFLVVPVENLGLGAVMRTNVMSGMYAALATNRPVLFVNAAYVGAREVQEPWYHASCDRQDVQCFFQPSSPCIVTYSEIENAPVLKDFRTVTKLYRNPDRMVEEESFDASRTVVLPVKTVTRRMPTNVPHILRNYTLDFAKNLPASDPRQKVLAQVAERLVSADHSKRTNQVIAYGFVFYAMRPHLTSQRNLREVLQQVVPANKAHPELTLGLPVRGERFLF